ncbi:hypothetical protein [Streptomyces sp. NPDC091371]|uniref:hypothetical protein n=1 Tax=Streptomyces sp. NPDC091371 TaxID=3155303 RepID=UPI00341CE06C
MRSTRLQKSVLVTVLGCVVLAGCGTRNAATDQTPAANAVSAPAPLGAEPGDNDPEMRFVELIGRILQSCDPDALKTPDGSGGMARPEDLPGGKGAGAPTPEYGPGETPPGVPNADGAVPVPLEDPAPPAPNPDAPGPKPLDEVPLMDIERCGGNEHAKRIGEVFKTAKTTDYREMREKLEGLDYPAERIHRMPDHAGAPRARVDLRFMGGHLVLEVTGTGSGVTVEAFGASEEERVHATEVKRTPKPDAPAF